MLNSERKFCKNRIFIQTYSMVICSFLVFITFILPQNSHAQENNKDLAVEIVTSNTISPDKIPLATYKFPSEIQILNELQLKKNNKYEQSIKDLKEAISEPSGSPRIKKIIEERCYEKIADEKNVNILSSTEDLPCIPYYISMKNQIVQLIDNSSEQKEPLLTLPLTKEKWQRLADKGFSQTFRMLKISDLNNFLDFAKFYLGEPDDCKYRNTGAALIGHAETWLTNNEIFPLIEKIYSKVAGCLKTFEDGYERTHLRVGLLKLAHNNITDAQVSLSKASLAENPIERFRSLFWLGVIEAAKSNKNGQNIYWETLLKKHPLELHSIITSQYLNIDPYGNLVNKKPAEITRKNNTINSQFNLATVAIELFLARKDYNTVITMINFILHSANVLSPQEILYLAVAFHEAKEYRLAISLISRFLRESQYENIDDSLLEIYFPRAYHKEILTYCADVDPVLVFALIRQESAFNPKALSKANARGLMQLLPQTARRYQRISPNGLYNESDNIKVGVKFISTLMEKFEGKAEQVLSAYNAGPSNAIKWQSRYPVEQAILFNDLIPFKETRFYVGNILRNAYWYGRLLTNNTSNTTSLIKKNTIEKSSKSKWHSDIVHDLLTLSWNTASKDTNIAQLFEIKQNTWKPENTLLDPIDSLVVQEFPELDSTEHSSAITTEIDISNTNSSENTNKSK